MKQDEPWQLAMFRVGLKKQQKLRMLLRLLGPPAGQSLLITHGDNNGALNHFLRAAGGSWSWAELEPEGIPGMVALLGEDVRLATARRLPFGNATFDRVVAVDVHEHLEDPAQFTVEMERVLVPGGLAIVTTPNGDPRLPVSRLKRRIGMTEAVYGHVVQGFRTEQLAALLSAAGLEPVHRDAYAGFFTELTELAINVAWVRLLSKGGGKTGIAPRTEDDLRRVRRTYRAYRTIFPFLRAVASLDALVPGRRGYAVAVAARKTERT